MTDHPAALVSVPVEPTREMWAAGGTAACQAANQHHDKVVEGVWSAMLAAAPQAAGVGEHLNPGDLFWGVCRASHIATNAVAVLRSDPEKVGRVIDALDGLKEEMDSVLNDPSSGLRAPSREPEGGAVWTGSGDYEPTDAMIDAGEYHNHRHNPLTNMVASFKAMMAQAEIDGLVSSTPALATREEAPAEAEELRPCPFCGPSKLKVDDWASWYVRCEECGVQQSSRTREGAVAEWNRRAQPQAREDAQPFCFDDEIAWLREAARYFAARDTKGEDRAHWANVYNADNASKLADRLGELSSNTRQLRPAPDALRVAVEALEPFAAACLDRESQNVKTLPGGASVRVTLAQCRAARKALAALQAEQGAK